MSKPHEDDYKTAAEALDRHCIVEAGAGTGKTFVLVARYVNAVLGGADPQRMPALTFTRKAAAEMRERVRKALLVSDRPGARERIAGLERAPIGTFHSFFADLLRRFAVEAGVSPVFTLVEPGVKKLAVIRRVRETVDLAARGAGPEEVSDAFKFLCSGPIFFDYKNILATTADLVSDSSGEKLAGIERALKSAETGAAPWRAAEERILSAFKTLCGAAALKCSFSEMDYAGLEERTLSFLRNERAAERVRAALDLEHIFVDEYQDSNRAQTEIIYRLAGARESAGRWSLAAARPRLFIVGDPKQSIYRFRGAEADIFERTKTDFDALGKDAEVLNLNVCKRSAPHLVAYFNYVFESKTGVFSVSGGGERQPFEPEYNELDARADYKLKFPAERAGVYLKLDGDKDKTFLAGQAEWVAGQILAMRKEGWSFKDMAVLMFSVFKSSELCAVFGGKGIPFNVSGRRGLMERPEIRDIISWMRALARPDDGIAAAACAKQLSTGLSDRGLMLLAVAAPEELETEDREGARVPSGLHQRLLHARFRAGGDREKDDFNRALAVFQGRMALFRRLSESLPAAALAAEIADTVALRQTWASVPCVRERARAAANIDEFIRALENSGPGKGDVFGFIDALDNGALFDDDPEAQPFSDDDDAVRIMNIHQAKGLEFKVVFVCNIESLHGGGGGERSLISFKEDGAPSVRRVRPDNPFEMEKSGSSDDETLKARAERRRLFYVALTRAQERLFLSGKRSITKDFEKGAIADFGDGASWILKREGTPFESDDKGVWRIPDGSNWYFSGFEAPEPEAEAKAFAAPEPAEALVMPEFRRLETIYPSETEGAGAGVCPVPLFIRASAGCPEPAPGESWKERELGDLVHNFFAQWDFSADALEEKVRVFTVRAGADSGAELFIRGCAENFLSVSWGGGPLHDTLRAARAEGRLEREIPFELILEDSPKLLKKASGRIDVVLSFKDDDGKDILQIFDYKTGSQKPEHYAAQMALYKSALEKDSSRAGKVVRGPILVYFNPGAG